MVSELQELWLRRQERETSREIKHLARDLAANNRTCATCESLVQDTSCGAPRARRDGRPARRDERSAHRVDPARATARPRVRP
jgi:hypothetical protein